MWPVRLTSTMRPWWPNSYRPHCPSIYDSFARRMHQVYMRSDGLGVSLDRLYSVKYSCMPLCRGHCLPSMQHCGFASSSFLCTPDTIPSMKHNARCDDKNPACAYAVCVDCPLSLSLSCFLPPSPTLLLCVLLRMCIFMYMYSFFCKVYNCVYMYSSYTCSYFCMYRLLSWASLCMFLCMFVYMHICIYV